MTAGINQRHLAEPGAGRDRANRIMWSVLGVVLLAAGVFGILVNQGLVPGIETNYTVLPEDLNDRWRDAGFWAPLLAIVAGVVLMALGVLLLRAELRRRGGRSLPELRLPDVVSPGHPSTQGGGADGQPHADEGQPGQEGPAAGGRTRIETGILARALSRDLASSRLVESASAHLIGTAAEPSVLLRLSVAPEADLSRLNGVVDGALARFAATTGVRPHLADVEVRLTRRSLGRVA